MTRSDPPLKARLRDPTPPQAVLDATWEHIQRRRSGAATAQRRLVAPALALALAALIASLTWLELRATRATDLTLADGSALAPLHTAADPRRLELSDGSSIELSGATELTPERITRSELHLQLGSGRAVFDVVPHGPRRWSIQAGDVQVNVLGTRFSVQRQRDRVHVDVERGLVEVIAPGLANGRVQLSAGQRVEVGPKPHTAALDAQPTAAKEPSPGPAHDVQPAPNPTHDAPAALPAGEEALPAKALPAKAALTPPSAAATAKTNAHDLSHWLARADAARRDGQFARAAQLFERAVHEHPNDPRAALAAFTLGRLYLEQLVRPGPAAAAFDRAHALGLPAALAEECARRRVEAHARAGQRARARAAAADYAARFPNGAYRAEVEAWSRSD